MEVHLPDNSQLSKFNALGPEIDQQKIKLIGIEMKLNKEKAMLAHRRIEGIGLKEVM